MDVSTEIQQWFDGGKDYAAGVLLFGKYCSPGQKILLKTLQRGPNKSYSIPKLERVLWELREKNQPHPQSPSPEREGATQRAEPAVKEIRQRVINIYVEQKSKTDYKLDGAPEVIVEAEKEWRKLYKESGALREAMRNVNNQFANHDRAKLIMEKELKVRELQGIVDDWRLNGAIPPLPSASPPVEGEAAQLTKVDTNDMVAVMKRIGNLRSNITKRKKKGDVARVEAFTRELEYLLGFVK